MTNVVVNSGFENTTPLWVAVLGEGSRSNLQAHSGSHSMRLVQPTGGGVDVNLGLDSPFPYYAVSAQPTAAAGWIYANAAVATHGYMAWWCWNAAGNLIENLDFPLKNFTQGGWIDLGGTPPTISPLTTHIQVRVLAALRFPNTDDWTAGDEFFLDDVVLEVPSVVSRSLRKRQVDR